MNKQLIQKGNNQVYLYILTLISAFISAFFLTSSVHLMKYDVLRNFYNIQLINLQELNFFLLILFFSFVILTLIYWLFLYDYLQSITAVFWMMFLLIFSIYSPVKSLVIGALIIAIPSLFITLSHSLDTLQGSFSKVSCHIHRIFSILTTVIFGIMVAVLIYKTKIVFVLPSTFNRSNINDSAIYAPHMIERWKEVLFVFLGLLGLGSIYYALSKYKPLFIKKIPSKIIGIVFVIVLLITQVTVLSLIMSYRVKVLNASTYDFGIFLQMFYNMKSFNGMVTTLERSMLLSHLQVHFSPIYYLMLPVFMIFPYGETLQVLQILVVAIGVIPLGLIMKEMKTHPYVRFSVMIMYIASPALMTSHFYDLHENCFLAPLILFVLYFALKKQTLFLFIFVSLTLLIKEDSALYLFFIGLYLFAKAFFSKEANKDIKTMLHGFILSIVSIIYFLVITNYLNKSGDGAMFWRYDNLMLTADSGLKDIILGFLLDPSYYLATFFAPLKINTILLLLGAVGFIPFFIKNFAGYLLIIPVVIMNYLSTYPYQHQFGFQYFYGSAVLIIFMVLLAEKDHQTHDVNHSVINRSKILHFFCLIGLSVSLVHSYHYLDENKGIIKQYQLQEELYTEMKTALMTIDQDKTVVASGFLTAYLSDRTYLYDYDYFIYSRREVDIDYFIIDGRIDSDKLDQIITKIEELHYVKSDLSTEHILVFEPNQ